jgi:rhodanese-related sulfurtransferase
MTHKLPFLTLLLMLGIAFTGTSHAIGWTLVNARVRSDFPDVKRISTAELAAWLNDPARPAPVLLDVRTREEFAVSHLQGAEHVQPDASASAVRYAKSRAIVTYCSVGYRSGGFAKKLIDAGYTHVLNLEGSIFAWANEGRPVVQNGGGVEKVHPYNRTWGLLLKKQYRADVRAAENR